MGVETWRIRDSKTNISPSVQGEAVMVIVTLFFAFTIMAGDWAPPDIVFTIVNSLFHTAGIVTDAQASAGYGNTGLLTVVFLYWVAEGVYQTGALDYIMTYLLGRSRSPFWGIVRMGIPVMAISAFLNNTPIVALMTPIIISWARSSGVPAKKLLIPLSFFATIGGTVTLIGTSTNLVISGQQTQRYTTLKKLEEAKFQIFDIAPYGIPYAIWGFLFIALTQKWLLPGNSSRYSKDLLIPTKVLHNATVAGKSIIDSGLKSIFGAQVVGISRKGVYQPHPEASFVVQEGDTVYFAGELDNIEFYVAEFGLEILTAETETGALASELVDSDAHAYHKLTQVTVRSASDLVGQSLSAIPFRTRFHSVVIGLQRGNGRQEGHLSDAVVAPGDILLFNSSDELDVQSTDFQANFTEVHLVKDNLAKSFIVSFAVKPKSRLVGKTLAEGGLRGIPGLFAFALDTPLGEHLDGIPRSYILQAGDAVWFAAELDTVTFLRKNPSLVQVQQRQVEKTDVDMIHRQLTQAVISPKSYLIGKTLRQAKFREHYSAAVVGIAREGVRVPLRVEEVVLQAGDVLLLEGNIEFEKEHVHDRAFALLLAVDQSDPPKRYSAVVAVFLTTCMVLTQVVNGLCASNPDYVQYLKDYLYRSDLINLWPAAVLTTFLMLVFRCLSFRQAQRSILWDVYLTVAAAFGVSNAVEATGLARAIANLFVDISQNVGGQGPALVAIYIATAVLSEILTNNAAGAVMYPIAATVADELNIEPTTMSIAIMLGASAGFINPFSYQCNLMVYSAGNYTFGEFAKVGAPFQVYLAIVAAFILCNLDKWHQVWIVSFVVLAAILAIAAAYTVLPRKITLPVEEKLEKYVEKPLGWFLGTFIFRPTTWFIKNIIVTPIKFVWGPIQSFGDKVSDQVKGLWGKNPRKASADFPVGTLSRSSSSSDGLTKKPQVAALQG